MADRRVQLTGRKPIWNLLYSQASAEDEGHWTQLGEERNAALWLTPKQIEQEIAARKGAKRLGLDAGATQAMVERALSLYGPLGGDTPPVRAARVGDGHAVLHGSTAATDSTSRVPAAAHTKIAGRMAQPQRGQTPSLPADAHPRRVDEGPLRRAGAQGRLGDRCEAKACQRAECGLALSPL
jgi:hypothetical protein